MEKERQEFENYQKLKMVEQQVQMAQQQVQVQQQENIQLRERLQRRNKPLIAASVGQSLGASENISEISSNGGGSGSTMVIELKSNSILREGRLMIRNCKNDNDYMNGIFNHILLKQKEFELYLLKEVLLREKVLNFTQSVATTAANSMAATHEIELSKDNLDIPNKPIKLGSSGQRRKSRFADKLSELGSGTGGNGAGSSTGGNGKSVVKFIFLVVFFVYH